jgi:hypothetical protein
VSCTARDAANNTSAPCTFTVTVNDTQAPVITCPGNITVTANTPTGAVVTYTTPTVTDNCSVAGTVTCSPASGSVFPNGTTTVTCTLGGQTVVCSFTVTVNRPAFNICAIADENNTLDYFVANTTTGYWEYHENGTCRVLYGVAETITRTSFFITLKDEDNPANRMNASFNLRTGLARVSVLDYATGTTRVITDYNHFNSVCPPSGYHCVAAR